MNFKIIIVMLESLARDKVNIVLQKCKLHKYLNHCGIKQLLHIFTNKLFLYYLKRLS